MSYNLPVSLAPSSALGVERAPSGPRWALAGFFLSGFLMALLGAILPAWGYHRDPQEFATVGNYFLCLALGLVASAAPARRIMERRGVTFLLAFGSGLAALPWRTWRCSPWRLPPGGAPSGCWPWGWRRPPQHGFVLTPSRGAFNPTPRKPSTWAAYGTAGAACSPPCW